MKFFQIVLLSMCVLLTSCSYFDTDETIEVTSADLQEPVVQEPVYDPIKVEAVIYQKTDGAVSIYDLDVDESAAETAFLPYSLEDPSVAVTGAVQPEKSVLIYPIDHGMRNTLKP